jgi:hypothetical protein
LLCFLITLPFIFDILARDYEGMKLESEIQNSIMTRYFYYQLVNIYVTVGMGGMNIGDQVSEFFFVIHEFFLKQVDGFNIYIEHKFYLTYCLNDLRLYYVYNCIYIISYYFHFIYFTLYFYIY